MKARTTNQPQQNTNASENLKSYNITQEKFFPNGTKSSNQNDAIRMHQSFYNNSGKYQSKGESLMSLDFK